jgi:hypothetical protein
MPGVLDGAALSEARCTFPGHITGSLCDRNVFYFVDESASPAVREFNAVTEFVTTLFRGSPLIAPGSLCAADGNRLLICDSGSSCIWSFDLSTKQLTTKISAENMYLLNVELFEEPDVSPTNAVGFKFATNTWDIQLAPGGSLSNGPEATSRIIPSQFIGNAGSTSGNRFSPSCVTRVRRGWYVFGDSNTHKSLYRYLEPDVVSDEVDRVTAATEVRSCYYLSNFVELTSVTAIPSP